MAQGQTRRWRRYWYLPVLTLLVALLLRYFLFSVYWVGLSPLPAQLPDGAWCFLLKGERAGLGDVVLCHTAQDGSAPALARVVALPSDTLRLLSGRLVLPAESYPIGEQSHTAHQRILTAQEYCLTTAGATDSLAVADLVIVPKGQIQARLLFYIPTPL